MRLEQRARRMLARRATAHGADPTMSDRAWAQDAIRELWLAKARAATDR